MAQPRSPGVGLIIPSAWPEVNFASQIINKRPKQNNVEANSRTTTSVLLPASGWGAI
jgi:hypothetical protein